MSDFAAVGMLMALGMFATCSYFFIDRLIREQSEVIVTGVLRGVPISVDSRRLIFYRYWLLPAAALVVYQILIVTGWMVMAQTARAGEVKTLTYLFAFFGSVAVLGAVYQAIVGYSQLVSVLRQAQER
jgi:hypothetical protein